MDGHESDSSMETSDNNSSDGKSIASEFDIWLMANDKGMMKMFLVLQEQRDAWILFRILCDMV